MYDPEHPLQALVTNLDASPYVGRLAICRVRNGSIKRGQQVAWCRADGSIERVQVSELYVTDALDRVDAPEAGPGEIIAVAGIAEITIGETLADLEDPRPLPVITVDEPSLSITIGINTSPMAGKEGSKLTARQVRERLERELVGNVSLRVLDTDRPEAWEVQGRGELQLAVLVEMMRREGFELTVGQPHVLIREIDGKRNEPFERLSIDVPEDYVGVVTQMLALRKGRMEHMTNHGTGWVRMEYIVPARGLIGFRTEFLTETQGNGPDAPRVRALGAMGRGAANPHHRSPGRRPGRQHRHLLTDEPLRARNHVRGAGRGGVRGHDRRRELARRRPRREPGQGEAPHQHPLLELRHIRAPAAPPQADLGSGLGVRARRRVRRGHARDGSPAQGRTGQDRPVEGGRGCGGEAQTPIERHSDVCARATARSKRCAASTSRSRPARRSPCWAQTAPASPPRST